MVWAMRSHNLYQLRKGTLPTNLPDLALTAAEPNVAGIATTNPAVVSFRPTSVCGAAARRIAVGYSSTAAGPTLQGRFWFFEQSTSRWYTLEAAKPLTLDAITMFDTPVLLDSAGETGGTTTHAYLHVLDNAAPDGTYSFPLMPSIS